MNSDGQPSLRPLERARTRVMKHFDPVPSRTVDLPKLRNRQCGLCGAPSRRRGTAGLSGELPSTHHASSWYSRVIPFFRDRAITDLLRRALCRTLYRNDLNPTKFATKCATKSQSSAFAGPVLAHWALWLLIAISGLFGAGQVGSSGAPALAANPAVTAASPVSDRFVPSVYKTFAEWKAACDRLPSNRSLKLSLPPKELLPLENFGQFEEVLEAFFKLSKEGTLAQSSAWLGQEPVKPQFFNTDAVYFLKPSIPFQPFVQRELVTPGTQIFLHGDLHGDIRSLVAWVDWMNRNGYLRDFRLTRPDLDVVFLGDYTDRGMFGIEVLYTLLRLKLENPTQVWLVRGNHEDVSLTTRYGFIAEGRGKYGRDFDAKRVMRLYDFLPLVLYLGCETNLAQCNHGGMEPGFDPRALLDAPESVRYQLLGRLGQQQFLKTHPGLASSFNARERHLMESSLGDFQPESPTVPAVIGFMWNDFSVVRGEPQFDFDPGRAFIYGEQATKFLLQQGSGSERRLQVVFRAHQHATITNAMMRRLILGHGVYRHWQENDSIAFGQSEPPVLSQKIDMTEERKVTPYSVWTFNVVPDSVYGELLNYSFDTFGLLTTGKALEDWKLRVINQTIRTR